MQWYEPEVKELEQRLRDVPPPKKAIAFYGSSSIRLWTTLADDFPGLPVVNLGFGGSTLAACAHFFERIVTPCAPAAIVCYAGDNDLGDGQRPEQVQASFRALRAKVQRDLAAARFAFISIKPSPARLHIRERLEAANRLVLDELASWPGARYIDVTAAMLGPDRMPRRELFAPDGLHLSQQGYRVWAEVLNAEKDKFA
jgi:lysophospholipase L1-like esterase